MIGRPRAVTLVLIGIGFLTITACGQMGPLMLATELPAEENEQGEDDQGEDDQGEDEDER